MCRNIVGRLPHANRFSAALNLSCNRTHLKVCARKLRPKQPTIPCPHFIYCMRTTVRSRKQMWKMFRRFDVTFGPAVTFEPCVDDYKLETMTLLMGMNMS